MLSDFEMYNLIYVGLIKKLFQEWRKQLLRLSKMLRHRGPDWNGIHSFRNCILAHERLSINGLHSGR